MCIPTLQIKSLWPSHLITDALPAKTVRPVPAMKVSAPAIKSTAPTVRAASAMATDSVQANGVTAAILKVNVERDRPSVVPILVSWEIALGLRLHHQALPMFPGLLAIPRMERVEGLKNTRAM